MPYTIPFTPKQKVSLTALQDAQLAAQQKVNLYLTAIVDGQPEPPSSLAKIQLTDEGILVTEPDAQPEPLKLEA